MKDLGQFEMGMVVLVTQIIFLYLRTINVKAVANGDTWRAIWTGWGIGLSWMIGIAIGAHSMMQGHPFPIIMHLIGGTIGTWMGMKKDRAGMQDHPVRIMMGKKYNVVFPTGRITRITCSSNFWIETLRGYVDDPEFKVEEL